MKITSRATFAGDPAAVYRLLIDRAFLEAVAVAGESVSYEVSSEPSGESGAAGAKTSTTQELESPSGIASFVGATITVVQQVSWHGASADGSRDAEVVLTVPKQPVVMNGTLALRPEGPGSVIDLAGELKVNIPLLGKKLEQASEPAILAGFLKQEEVARDWLQRS